MQREFHIYQIFDYNVASNVPFPELKETKSGLDTKNKKIPLIKIEVRSKRPELAWAHGWFHEWKSATGETTIFCGRNGMEYRLQFPRIAEVDLIPSTNTIICYPLTKKMSLVRHIMLDQVIPRLLCHCGDLVLHCSGVKIENTGVLFIGESGFGKSTLAMHMCSKNFPMFSDDCAILRRRKDGIEVISNYPGTRFWPASLSFFAPDKFSNESEEKVRLDLTDFGYKSLRSELCRKIKFFIIDPPGSANGVSISPLCGTTKVIDLLKSCFYLDVQNPECHQKQFENIVKLSKKTNICFYSLSYERSYQQLDTVSEKIINCCLNN